MRTKTSLLIAVSLLSLGACKSELDDKPSAVVKSESPTPVAKAPEAPAANSAAARELAIDPAQSRIEFVGAKVTDDHEGSFSDFSGKVTVAGNEVTGMSFTVQTASLRTPDSDKLEAHLKSADLLDVEKFPQATFASTAIRKQQQGQATHEIEGALTLHGVTKTITFPAAVSLSDDKAKGTAEFKINRKDFGISYPGMPDDLIKDDVLLKIELVAPVTTGKA